MTSECDYRINLTCTNNICTCTTGYNYDATYPNVGVTGLCKPAGTYLDPCSSNDTCSASQNLFCNGSSSGVCLCDLSWSYWDGITCASKLSIGGQCSTNTHCMASKLLFCSNYTQSAGTCDCDKNHYWNETCMPKLLYAVNCSSNYFCDDNRGLLCRGLSGSLAMFQKCDCYNNSYTWDSLYINRSQTCIQKLGYNTSTCYGQLECEDFNYLACVSGVCLCNYTDYYDGSRCQPKRTYLDPCNYTYFCKDYDPVNLVCRIGPAGSLQCVCNISAYWENCTQRCVTAKKVPTITLSVRSGIRLFFLDLRAMYSVRQLYEQRMRSKCKSTMHQRYSYPNIEFNWMVVCLSR